MRRLVLLRHAKSAWDRGVADRERPLAARGREAAPRMAAHLAEEGPRPDLALVSGARRTRETWDLVKPALGEVPERIEPRIYEAPAERLLAVIHEVEDAVSALLMVGHNPGFEDLAARLVGEGDAEARARLAAKYPTAGLAVIAFRGIECWRDVAPGSGRLERFVTPKSLGAGEDD